ncbi:putative Intradiol ring-cleavage dioxygenase [Seiridium unicorne]|uniref:Intradiol ring-cleavage dioxygenase n=1 Tax=Seiridium unicorne TaxID=138068 RepID=A0ABR2UWK3_9PEZI
MARYLSTVALLATSLMGGAMAHPGADIQAEIAERAAWQAHPEYRSLKSCESTIKARDHKLVSARMEKFDHLREKRGLEKRTFKEVLLTNHHSNKTVTPDSTPEEIFGSDNSCILQPHVTEGPYWVSGELVREDITDDEPGVPLTFDIQLIDTTTCEPLSNVALEAWYCNSTGVYGGVSARNNGNPNDPNAAYNTALRGIQYSDDDGILSFDAIMPGHYTGRAVHIHIMAHIGATTLANGTIAGGTIAQVGQLFFDQSLNEEVDAIAPYSTNTQAFTVNGRDGIMGQEAATSDPVFNYVYLGDTVDEGIFGWATVGINPNVKLTARPAAHYSGPA